MVSNTYLNKTYNELENTNHIIKIMNRTKNLDLTPFLENTSINISRNTNDNGTLNIGTMSLSFELSSIENDVNEKFRKNDVIEIMDIFNREEVSIFKGLVDYIDVRVSIDQKIIGKITINDFLINGQKKLYEDELYINQYYYNSNDKNNSILYRLVKKLGFNDHDILIEEIKDNHNNYFKLPVLKLEKGKKIIEELGELVASICGNIYILGNGKIKITSLLNQKDTNLVNYELNNKNILEFFEVKNIEPKENKILINFTEYREMERQPIFVLAGKNADYENDDAKVLVRKNSPKSEQYWKISYITENVGNVDKNNIEIRAYKYVGDRKEYVNYNQYEINFDNNTLRFWNTNNFDIFIEKFKIYGTPIKELKGNSVSYSEEMLTNELDYNVLTINNRFITTNILANEMAKYKYFQKCRNEKQYKLVCNSIPFIELEDVVRLDFKTINKQVQVIGINQYHDRTELTLKDYEIFRENSQNTKSFKSNEFDSDKLVSNSVKYGDIKLDENKPPIPLNVRVTSDVIGFQLQWDVPDYKEIRGYYVYIKNINNENLLNKIFTSNSNNTYIRMNYGSYRVAMSTVNLKGIESDLTDYLNINILKIQENDIEENAITSDKIHANAINSKHINANSINAGHIITDSVTVDKLKFTDTLGLEKVNIGSEEEPNYKLRLNGNIEFANDVHLKGKITGNDLVVLQDEALGENSKKVELSKSGLDLYEYDTDSNIWSKTLGIRKMKSGVFHYKKETENEWLDVRDFPNQVWNNVDIKASLQSFNVRNNTRRVFTEITRNPNNKHLFKIKVGGVATAPLKTDTRTVRCRDYGRNDVNTREEIVLFEEIFRNFNKVKLTFPEKIEITYKYWYDGRASNNALITRKKEMRLSCKLSYRKIGTQEWIGETLYNELYIDTEEKDLNNFEIKVQIISSPILLDILVGKRDFQYKKSFSQYSPILSNQRDYMRRFNLTEEELNLVKTKENLLHGNYPEGKKYVINAYATSETGWLYAWNTLGEKIPTTLNYEEIPKSYKWYHDISESKRDNSVIYHYNGTVTYYSVMAYRDNLNPENRKYEIRNTFQNGDQEEMRDQDNPIMYLFYGDDNVPLLSNDWWRKDWEGSGISYSDRNIIVELSQEKLADVEGGTAIWTATEY